MGGGGPGGVIEDGRPHSNTASTAQMCDIWKVINPTLNLNGHISKIGKNNAHLARLL